MFEKLCINTRVKRIVCYMFLGFISAWGVMLFVAPIHAICLTFIMGLFNEYYLYMRNISSKSHFALFSTQIGSILAILINGSLPLII